MAKNKNNVVTNGFSGAIGKDIVFRQTGGEVVIAKLPVKSKKQNPVRELLVYAFRKAILYAISVMSNQEVKAMYERVAKGMSSAYNLALRDARKAPEVREIIISRYKGIVGDAIRIYAIDDFKVVAVHVAIYSSTGTLLEEGSALFPQLSMEWVYTTTVANPQLSGSKIIVTAMDMPGNETVAEKILS